MNVKRASNEKKQTESFISKKIIYIYDFECPDELGETRWH